ncbi:MAG: hypothetical protein ACI9OU_002540, partial [Candidatus Promineifilaceae bacterium]
PDLCAKGPNAGVVSSNGLRGINQREEMPFVGAAFNYAYAYRALLRGCFTCVSAGRKRKL